MLGSPEKNGSSAEPTELDLNTILNDATGFAERRRRLSDVSWFVRCLAEPIARSVNRDDEVSARFLEGGFRAQPLLDETAIPACMLYVDLNSIRAGVSATTESRDFTSVKAREVSRFDVALTDLLFHQLVIFGFGFNGIIKFLGL